VFDISGLVIYLKLSYGALVVLRMEFPQHVVTIYEKNTFETGNISIKGLNILSRICSNVKELRPEKGKRGIKMIRPSGIIQNHKV
jgi:hypothetical protein